MSEPVVSVIVTTYNWPEALRRVVASLAVQHNVNFEVLIADDGSDKTTFESITELQKTYPITIKHVWQPDDGFQAAKIRNKAVTQAKGDYLVFIDGDCMPLPHFLSRHQKLAEKNWMVAGNRVLLNETFTKKVLANNLSLDGLTWREWLALKNSGECNRILPLIFLPWYWRKLQPRKWQGAKTCNLGLWKQDFLRVNGFDESYRGWGHEDSDLVIRLMKLGIKRKDGRFAIPVVHLWHKEYDRTKQHDNLKLLHARLRDNILQAAVGIDQYL